MLDREWIQALRTDVDKTMSGMTVEELARVLEVLSDHYYNDDALVSDAVFDRLQEHLRRLDPQHPSVRAVGSVIRSERTKVALPYRMGSLDKIKAEDSQVQARLTRWTKQFPGPYVVSQKLDGSSGLLVWRREDKTWTPRLYTRGDGYTGVDISHLASYLLPLKSAVHISTIFPDTDEVALRGELLIRRDVFQKKYAAMARPRSLVNGLVNRKEIQPEVALDVDFVVYEVVSPRMPKTEQFVRMKKLGMKVVQHEIYPTAPSAKTLETSLRTQRPTALYDMDGLVVEANGPYPLSNDRTPDYAIAFKVADDAMTTTVTGIQWNASKDGLWKPTVQYEPVTVAGTVLKNATGFHAQFIREKKLGPGAVIRVGLGGDVIPQVVEILQPATKPQFPPEGDYEWEESGVEIRLTPAAQGNTPEYRRAQLQHFVTTLHIPHLSEGTLTKLQEAGIDTIPALLQVTAKKLASLPGLGDKSAQRIIDGLREKTQGVPLARWMAASNAFGRGFAEKRLQMIVDAFPGLMDSPPTVQQLCTVDGVEEKTAIKFMTGLPLFQQWLRTVPGVQWASGRAPAKAPVQVQDGPWKGHVVVFTGFRSDVLRTALEERGATVSESVSKKTTVLVSKDGDTTSAKAKKALETGARILSKAALEKELAA